MNFRNLAKFGIPALVLSIGLLVPSGSVSAKPEYMKKEKKACTACHVKANSKELNEVGKCYQKNSHSLEKCSTN